MNSAQKPALDDARPVELPHRPRLIAVAEFTRDMVTTLSDSFEIVQSDGIAGVEVTDRGLWLIHPIGARFFLGAARPHDGWASKQCGLAE